MNRGQFADPNSITFRGNQNESLGQQKCGSPSRGSMNLSGWNTLTDSLMNSLMNSLTDSFIGVCVFGNEFERGQGGLTYFHVVGGSPSALIIFSPIIMDRTSFSKLTYTNYSIQSLMKNQCGHSLRTGERAKATISSKGFPTFKPLAGETQGRGLQARGRNDELPGTVGGRRSISNHEVFGKHPYHRCAWRMALLGARSASKGARKDPCWRGGLLKTAIERTSRAIKTDRRG
jgi:hypothetical protein